MSLTKLTWTNRNIRTHLGNRALPSTVLKHPEGDEFILYAVGSLFPDQSDWFRPTSRITGNVWHHDAVQFSGEDVNFDGHTSDEEFRRMLAIYNYHINLNGQRDPKGTSWNGIGYSAMQGLEDRLYVPRIDVLETHRAHVSTSASAGTRVFPAAGQPNWNQQLVGLCKFGDWTRQGPNPPLSVRRGGDAFFRAVTDCLGTPMTLRPHKYYQTKACPGDWATVDSWEGLIYLPSATGQPTPAPQPEPVPATHEVRPGEVLSIIARQYGLTVAELAAWNNIADIHRIEPGQLIRLTPPPAPAPTPAPTPDRYQDGVRDGIQQGIEQGLRQGWTEGIRHAARELGEEINAAGSKAVAMLTTPPERK